MSFWKARKITALLANIGSVSILLAFSPVCLAQSGGSGGSGGAPTSSSPDISGAEVQSSELVSKSSEMPKFQGFEGLNVTTFLGNSGNYLYPRDASGANRSIMQTRSSSSSRTQRTSSGASMGSSGNTRTTGSRTTSRSGGMGNRNTSNMGMRGGMGGMGRAGGANSNTVQAVTTLGYSLNEFSAANLPTTAATRAPQIESRINSSRVQPVVPVTVEIKDKTAVLRGVVKNEHDRRLLEQFVKLEPGIVKVQNELLCSIDEKKEE